jgi:hypothetical protein
MGEKNMTGGERPAKRYLLYVFYFLVVLNSFKFLKKGSLKVFRTRMNSRGGRLP